jgi:MazG family protein
MSRQPQNQSGERFPEVVEVMRRLLAPDGCPWDREQTFASLKPFLIEEAYEVLEALDHDDVPGHRDELGDLLFQIVFHAALRAQRGEFGIDDVCGAIAEKMRRRHPHVFGDVKVSGSEEVLQNWGRLKEAEHREAGRVRRVLDGIPRALPALLRAQRLGEKAATVGFDWPDIQGIRAKVEEELRELDEAIAAGAQQAVEHELGDLLFTLTRLSARLQVAPEDALRAANARFEARFRILEDRAASDGKRLADMSLDELEAYWQQAKAELAKRGPA